jgi:replication factor C small subunit
VKKWIEKYRPKTIDEMCLDDGLREMFNAYLENNDIPNMLLAGRAGIGKTTLAHILGNSFENNTVMFISASEENGIDAIKSRVRDFVDMCAFDGGLKIVILDEADGLSKNTGGNGSSAQDALRNLMESDLEDTRFILTCNGKDRLIEAIRSRNPVVDIKFDLKQVVNRVFHILKSENISYTEEDKQSIVKIIHKTFPDIRQTIGVIQNCCATGKFVQTAITNESGINTTIEYIRKNINNPRICREYWIKNAFNFGSDYLELGKVFFNSFEGTGVEDLLLLGEKYYQMHSTIDNEIGFYNMVLVASKFKKI